MPVTTTSGTELDVRARGVYAQLRRLLAGVDPGLQVQGGSWTAQEVAAHVLTVFRRYTARDFTQRAGLSDSPGEVGEQNQAELEAVRDLPMGRLLEALDGEMERYLVWDGELDGTYPFHAGTFIDGYGARGNMIGEMLVHGHDVAVAAGRPWPIANRDMLLVLNGVLQVCSAWLDPELAARGDRAVVFRIRGGTPQLFSVRGGALTVRDARPGDRPDSVVMAPAAPVGLLMYGRISLAAAVRRGVMVVGGRRPWRALGMPNLFVPV